MQKENRTQRKYQAQINFLENLYISPLEQCNLHCRYCYTTKTKNILTQKQILSFITRYQKYLNKLSEIRSGNYFHENFNLKSIIFCGGEVFTLKYFPDLINILHQKNIFTTIITNGTIDSLTQIKNPNLCQLLVSFDGPQNIHDQNRGIGSFQKSLKFVKHAVTLGFHVEIFFLVTANSYPYLDTFNLLNLPQTYLIDRLGSLSPAQTQHIFQHYPTYPPRNFGCHQISLQSNSLVYPCCETKNPIGKISDSLNKLVKNYLKLVSQNPLCIDPNYSCNLNNII